MPVLQKPYASLIKVRFRLHLVVDADLRLLGTLTDGDIRTRTFEGRDLESLVEMVMHREFRFVREGVEEQEYWR